MCGRYGLYDVTDAELLKENSGYDFKPSYNVAPSQKMPVVVDEDGKPKVKQMVWGIPRKLGPDVEKDIINTRSEKALDRFWGKTVRTQRCLIPANGFFEWKKTDNTKVPFWIFPKDHELFYFAGIYDIDNSGNYHYSIMTTTPNKEMSEIHNRMPVILKPMDPELWLTDSEDGFLQELLEPLRDNSLSMHQVSKDVNLLRNNSASILKPV